MKIPTTLIGCHVDRTTFDYQVRLGFSALDPDEGYRVDADLVIEAPFLLCDRDGEWHELDPGTGTGLAPAWSCSAEPSPLSRSAARVPSTSPSTTAPSCTSVRTRSTSPGT
jgi:Family of unknown function (DUF6188)